MNRSLSPKSGPSHDVVMTPQWLADKCVEALNPSGTVLEPAAGDGAFTIALSRKRMLVVHACEITRGSDFLDWIKPVDWIVSNPPWSQFRPFLVHAMRLAPDVAFLTTVNHWFTKARVRDVAGAGFGYRRLWMAPYPSEFPSSGFQLGLMHIQRGYTGPMDILEIVDL